MTVTMTSKRLVVTRMDGPEDQDPGEVQHPAWKDIESAVRRLNGGSCSLLILGIGPPPVPHMAIGGGDQGRYIVYVTPDNVVFYKLVNPNAPQGKWLMVAGGQEGDYDLELCVGLTEALQAAKTYAESGMLDPKLAWK
jgi:hypothetical protein